MTENFPQINVRHQTTDPGSLENINQDECRKLHPGILYPNYQKSKIKKNSWKKPGKNEEKRWELRPTSQKLCKQGESGVKYLKSIKRVKKISHQFRILGGKYPSKVNEKYFLKQKLRAFVTLQKKMVSLKNIYLSGCVRRVLVKHTRSLLCHTRSFVVAGTLGLVALLHVGSQFPDQGSTLHPSHCKVDS